MQILVVDDETLARDRLRRLLESDGEHEVVGEAANGAQAVMLCESLRPELVLLDIRMPGMDGLETARHFLELTDPPAVIFCTAYEEHAIQAFDLQAVGYLLKPVRKEKLLAALEKTVRLNRAQLAALNAVDSARRSHISARTHKGIELIAIDDVRYFQADQKYVTVRYSNGEVIVDDTLRELEEEFAELFVRVHRSALVAKSHIEGLIKASDGQMAVRLQGLDESISISRRHLPGVRKIVKRL
jgi:two-component system, LytTR family, response regulator AlgR